MLDFDRPLRTLLIGVTVIVLVAAILSVIAANQMTDNCMARGGIFVRTYSSSGVCISKESILP